MPYLFKGEHFVASRTVFISIICWVDQYILMGATELVFWFH